MSLNTDHIKLIFGLKLKQIRQDKQLSLSELSQKCGLSVSYLNEIEKGKKYPKADKISSLSDALEVDYDGLVSLKLNKKLEPITQLLKSNFLTEIPFDFFGIDPASLLEMLSDAPVKLSAFINTIIKIARSYSMSVEQFYFAVLRSYQEMHNNYFEDLESTASRFLNDQNIATGNQLDEFYLLNYLFEKHSLSIENFSENEYPTLKSLRSVYIQKSKKILINSAISTEQRAFTLAKELGFAYLHLKVRPTTSSWIAVNSFEEVFNNFQASYFAGAILIKKQILESKLNDLFNQKEFSVEDFTALINFFKTTPETLLHRIISILPHSFGIDKLFFLRFEVPKGTHKYNLTKELHLGKQHNPQENKNENYCRRWLSLNILDDLAIQQNKKKSQNDLLVQTQISEYVDAENQYLIISIAQSTNNSEEINASVSIGIEINKEIEQKIEFISSNAILRRKVNQTCEKCAIFDCKERVAAPIILQKKRLAKAIQEEIKKLV